VTTNKWLTRASKAKKDEFYTSYDVIQSELKYYEDKFADKTVLCNCDNPFESNFTKFFLCNFNHLKLKRLICTSYAGSPMTGKHLSLFDDYNKPVPSQHGYVLDITNVSISNGRGVSDADITTILHQKGMVKQLKGNGDYVSDECLNYLKQSDIVVTNPPFSKFRSYLATLIEYNKQFLIIGNLNAITYKEVFPLIKNNQLRLGASIHSGSIEFRVPDDYPLKATGNRVDDEGNKYICINSVRWFTNLDYKQHHEDLTLCKHYLVDEYPKYDNYDAINVNKVADIPMDYSGIMGVPITFLDKYNPEQFEIIGETSGRKDFDKEAWPTIKYENAKQHSINGRISNGSKANTRSTLRVDEPTGTYYTADNVSYKLKSLYARILVRNKKVQK